MRAGAGLVTLGVPKSLNPVLESQVTEVMTYALPETTDHMLDTSAMDALQDLLIGKTCLAIGPGIGMAEETKQLLFRLLEKIAMPVVIDADGLNILSEQPEILRSLNIPVILTPHPGEMGRLCGISPTVVQEDRIGRARHLATSYHVHVVLKGARTVMAHPDGRVPGLWHRDMRLRMLFISVFSFTGLLQIINRSIVDLLGTWRQMS